MPFTLSFLLSLIQLSLLIKLLCKLLDVIDRIIVLSTPTNSIYKRTSYALRLRLLLTEWVGRVAINRLPDEVLLHIPLRWGGALYAAFDLEVASVSPCVPEMEIRWFCVAKLSPT